MAITTRQTTQAPAPLPPATLGPARSLLLRGPVGLGVALFAAVAYSVFASGATAYPAEARVQAGLAIVGVFALVGVVAGGLRMRASRGAFWGVGLLALFALWAALSVSWSIAPDLSWTQANRALAYALVAVLAIALGSSLPRALERTALAYLGLALVVALYALGGKVAPWLDVGPIDLNHAEQFSRLRAPVGYWNGLGLFLALAAPIATRLAADATRSARLRGAGIVALAVLVLGVALTYSRGGILALAVGLTIAVVAAPERLRVAATTTAGLIGAGPAILVGFLSDDLTTDGLSVSSRSGDGVLLLAAVVAGAGLALLLARALPPLAGRAASAVSASVAARRAALGAAGAALLAGAVLLLVSGGGITGVSEDIGSAGDRGLDVQNDPGRIFQANSGNRWEWWNEAAGAWADQPVAGHGAGSFPLLHLRHRNDRLEVLQPHSVPLQFLAETGLIGALLALGGLVLLGTAAWRRVRSAGGVEGAYAAALGGACAAWGVHMWVDWDWDIPALALPLMIFLGVLAARPPGTQHGSRRPLAHHPRRRALAVAGATGALALVAISSVLPSLAADRTREALDLARRGDERSLARAAQVAAEARKLNPLAADGALAGATIAERRGRYAEASSLLSVALERQPDNPRVWLRVARFAFLVDDAGAGLRAAQALVRLDPRNEGGRLLLLFGDVGGFSASATGTPLPSGPFVAIPAPPELAELLDPFDGVDPTDAAPTPAPDREQPRPQPREPSEPRSPGPRQPPPEQPPAPGPPEPDPGTPTPLPEPPPVPSG